VMLALQPHLFVPDEVICHMGEVREPPAHGSSCNVTELAGYLLHRSAPRCTFSRAARCSFLCLVHRMK
jgi:hypothetical protein